MKIKIRQLLMTAMMAMVVCSSACSQEKGFIIKGHLEGMAGSQLYVISGHEGKSGPEKITVDNNGDFEFRDTVPSTGPAEYSLMDPSGVTMFKGGAMMGVSDIFYAQNGDVIHLSGSKLDFALCEFSGNKWNAENMELKNQLKDVHVQEKKIWDQVGALMRQHNPANRPKIDSLQNLADPFEARARQIKLDFISQHPDALISAHAMSEIASGMKLGDAKTLFASLSKEVQESASGKNVQEMLGLEVAEENSDAGKPAPDFVKQTKEGKTFKLSDYKGKYVLLDFWGSWCGACRASHPHLKEINEKYGKQGLVIIGIAYERTQDKTAWIKAIKEDGLPWTQILNDQGQVNVVDLYGVNGFPTKVLIDREGNIVMRIVGTNVTGGAHGQDNSSSDAANSTTGAAAGSSSTASSNASSTASASTSSASASNDSETVAQAAAELTPLDKKLKEIFKN
ncbi:MAG TPA: TlpA disulfide reductase family protein [Puia sp.]|nr:TlpA disulfide reductase family protein [Puia sp.]